MRGVGQIAELCAIARPTIALVTSIGPEHLELLGSVEQVAAANAEAIAALPPGGTAVVPESARELDPHLKRGDIEVRRFSPNDFELENGRGRFRLDGQVVELELPFTQRHQAATRSRRSTPTPRSAFRSSGRATGCRDIAFSPWRGEELPLAGGRLRDQRRLQREPGLDARCSRASGRARGRAPEGGDPRRDGRAGRGVERVPRRDRRCSRRISASTSSVWGRALAHTTPSPGCPTRSMLAAEPPAR